MATKKDGPPKYRSLSALGDATPWFTISLLGLLVAIFFAYRFAQVPAVRDEPLTFEGKTLTGLDTIDKLRLKAPDGNIFVVRDADRKLEELIKADRHHFIIVEGPKGSGKTYAVRETARRLDRPYIRTAVAPGESADDIFVRIGLTLASGVEAPQAFVEKTLADHALLYKGVRAVVHFEVCDLDDGQRHAEIVQVAKWLADVASVVVDAPPDALSPLYEKEHGRFDRVVFDEFTPQEAAEYCAAVGADASAVDAHLQRNGYLPLIVARLARPMAEGGKSSQDLLDSEARDDLLSNTGVIQRALGTAETRRAVRLLAALAYNKTESLRKLLPDDALQADFAEHRPKLNAIAHLKRLLRVVTDDNGAYHVAFRTRAMHTLARRILGTMGGQHDANGEKDA